MNITEAGKWTLLAAFIAPLVFSFFFVRHTYYIYAHDMSEWKGGVMGMFSGHDHPSKRHFYFYITDTQGREYSLQPVFSEDPFIFHELIAFPDPVRFAQVRDTVFSSPLYVMSRNGSTLRLTDQEALGNGTTFSPSKLRIEMWKMHRFDSVANTIHKKKVHEWVFE